MADAICLNSCYAGRGCEIACGVCGEVRYEYDGAVLGSERGEVCRLTGIVDGIDGLIWCRDIGTAEDVMGKDLPTPLQLPW